MIVIFVLFVFFGGFLGQIILGSPFGIIFASVLAALVMKGRVRRSRRIISDDS